MSAVIRRAAHMVGCGLDIEVEGCEPADWPEALHLLMLLGCGSTETRPGSAGSPGGATGAMRRVVALQGREAAER